MQVMAFLCLEEREYYGRKKGRFADLSRSGEDLNVALNAFEGS